MAERKMVDADGHIREIESDVFEYLPEHYKTPSRCRTLLSASAAPRLASPGRYRRDGRIVFRFRASRIGKRHWIKATSRRRWFIPRASCTSVRWVWSISPSI